MFIKYIIDADQPTLDSQSLHINLVVNNKTILQVILVSDYPDSQSYQFDAVIVKSIQNSAMP
jgi:hypothetical protein